MGTVLDSIADTRKAFVVDFAAVPFLDSTAANAMSRVATKAKRQGIRLFITGASPTVRRVLLTHGVTPPRAKYRETIARAIADIKGHRDNPAAAAPEGLTAGSRPSDRSSPRIAWRRDQPASFRAAFRRSALMRVCHPLPVLR